MIRPDDAEGLHNRGTALLAQRRYEEALASYDKALAIRPGYIAALHCRGIVLRNLNRPAEALASHDRALAIRPDDAEGLYVRGNALLALKRYAEALTSFDRALAIHPGYVAALHNRGIALRYLRRAVEALASHDRALAIRPGDAEGLYNRGIVLFALKRPEEALAAYDKALVLDPDCAKAFNNRGNVLFELERYGEAIASYDKALAIFPDYVEALHSRGTIAMRILRRPQEALASHDRALAIRPNDADGHYNRGISLFALKRLEEALAAYDKALALDPNHAEALRSRGTVLRMLKRSEEAIASYRQALDKGGDSEEIKYLLAGLSAAASPITAPRKFITELFDQCADNFEEHLVSVLKYQAPALISDAVARFVSRAGASAGNFDILDLGCGTGLVGERLRPLARTLTGVDLSPNMLEQARKRKIYDQLVCDELTEFLQAQAGRFDLVVAGDVFIYIGDLSKVFHGVRGALRDGGLLGFSVEVSHGEDFALGTHLRYAHAVGYLQKLANDNRLALESIESGALRQEEGMDVDGRVLVMRAIA